MPTQIGNISQNTKPLPQYCDVCHLYSILSVTAQNVADIMRFNYNVYRYFAILLYKQKLQLDKSQILDCKLIKYQNT